MEINEAAQKLHEMVEPQQEDQGEESTQEGQAPEEEVTEATEQEGSQEEAEDSPDGDQESEKSDSKSDEADQGAETFELEADQFAELLGVKSDRVVVDDDGVKIRVEVDGKPADVTPEQLINAYQGDATLTNRSKELASLKKERESKLNELVQQSNQFAQQTASILEKMKDAYISPMSKEELSRLKEDDPGQYAAVKQEIREREEAFQRMAQEALNTVQEAQQTQTQEFNQQYQEYLKEQAQILTEAVPNIQTELPNIEQKLQAEGFSDDELKQIADARIYKLAYKAMLYDKGQQGAKAKMAKKVPRLMKPGKPKSAQETSLEQQQKARQRLKESGSLEDAVAAFKATKRK